MRRLLMAASAAALLGGASAHASAPTFSPVEIGLQVGGTFAFGPGNVTVRNDEASGGISATEGPWVTAEGSTAPTGFSSQSVDTTADWNFEVVGPPTTGTVLIDINGNYQVSSSGHSGTVANIFVGDNFASFNNIYTVDCSNGVTGDCSGHAVSVTAAVPVNRMQEIRLHVGGAVNGATGAFSVTLDPLLSLDSAYAGQGYTLYVAPDAQGAGGVPEPAAWALMITGFGLAGAGVRKGRRDGKLPAAAA